MYFFGDSTFIHTQVLTFRLCEERSDEAISTNFERLHDQDCFATLAMTECAGLSTLMPSQFVIPETFLIGNPVFKLLKAWIPDKSTRG